MSVTVMGLVWNSTVPGSNRRHVLVALADRCDEEGVCWPGVAHLARKTDISRRQVFRILNELETEGWIIRDNTRTTPAGDQDTNLYQIDLERLRGNPLPPVDHDEEQKVRLARLEEARERRSGGSDTMTLPPPKKLSESSGGSDTMTLPSDKVTLPWCHGVTTPSDTMTPYSSVHPSENLLSGHVLQVPHQRADHEEPPTPHLRPLPGKPETWKCAHHLANPDPADKPCLRCKAERLRCQERQAVLDAEVAAAEAEVARRARIEVLQREREENAAAVERGAQALTCDGRAQIQALLAAKAPRQPKSKRP